MNPGPDQTRWERLTRLLGPIHAQAVATARRLSRSIDEGDDLYQESVLRAFERLDGLRDESSFRSWFFAILLSRHRSGRRRASRRAVPMDQAIREHGEPVAEDGSRWEEQGRRAERAARALSVLSPEQREAVVLFEVEGFSVEEIASLQAVTESAVKSRLARGRERLRRFYTRELGRSARGNPGLPAEAAAWSGQGEIP